MVYRWLQEYCNNKYGKTISQNIYLKIPSDTYVSIYVYLGVSKGLHMYELEERLAKFDSQQYCQ